MEALGRAFWADPEHAVAIMDLAGTVTAWSPGAALLTGFGEPDAIGRDLSFLREDDAAPATAERLRSAALEPLAGSAWHVRPDGTRWWAETTLFPLRGGAGEGIVAFAEIFRDATDARRGRDLQDEADVRFAGALSAGRVAVFRQDRDLRYTWGFNPIPELHATMDSIIGAADADFLPADVAVQLTERKLEVLRTGERARFDVTASVDGWTLFYDVAIEPLVDADGTVVGVTGVSVNVTEQRWASEQLRRSSRRLAEAERLAAIGSWERDLDRGTSYWSPGIFALFGLDPQTARPSFETFLDVVHPDDREDVESVIRGAERTGGAYEIEHRIVRASGRVRWLYSRAEVLAAGPDGPRRIAGTARDVTEAHRVGVALRDAAERISPTARQDPQELRSRLSARQLEVLALVADGLGNREIADRLFISESTVKWHVRQILRALGVANRAQAVARYLGAGQQGHR